MTYNELLNIINSNITENGQRLITGAKLNSVLTQLLAYADKSLTNEEVLPFDGVTETTQSVITSSTTSENIFIYYSTAKSDFVAYNIEDNKLYSGFQSGFKNKTKYTKDGIYIDNDGNIYAFIDGVFTQVVGVGKHFTSHSKVNKAIKELYIVSNNENYDVSDMYVAFICRKWKDSNNDLIKCQLQIKHDDGTIVCQYGDYIADYTHEPPSIVELKEANSSGVSGYALVDWVAITEGYIWYQSNYEGKAILNKEYCSDINFSNAIKSHINKSESTPSGDPMHYAYESAGAVWNGESWQADQRKGLTNEQVRQLFLKEDMSEMLFRKMWNMAGEGVATRCKYNANTGFYEANGVWHMTYEDALLVYATTYSMKPTYNGLYATRNSIMGMTTIPSIANRPVFGFPPIMWAYKIIDVTFQVDLSDEYWYNSRSVLSPEIGYSPNLRVVRGYLNLYGTSNATPIMIRANSLLHIYIVLASLSAAVTNLANASIISYASLYTSLNKRSSTNAHTLKLHPTVYGFVTGTINPEELSKEPMRPEYADYDLIPYQQNLKIVPDNAFWREELDVKGINGEYVYPSFAEYLANNPSNFATAEEWQALATLAQEKNVTLVQG